MAFNALINTGALVPFAISLSDAINSGKSAVASTTIEIGAGLGANGDKGDFGGHVPAVAIWNAQGERLGQWMPGKKDNIDSGTSNANAITVEQNQGATGQPEYVQLVTVSDDALCLTYVAASGNGVSWTWMGDVGYTCGGDWYPSTAKFGTDNYQPKCTWLDANHSDDLRFMAMSMHMPDFNGDQALVDEYNAHSENLCNSRARFMQWGELQVNPGFNQIPPMFDPALEYNTDGSDKDFDALFKPGRVNEKRDLTSGAAPKKVKRNGKVEKPGHVVISDYKAHRAHELCDSETSRGPSFVSTQDGFYCDMSTKTAYPVCSEAVKNHCFDLDTRELVAGQRGHPKALSSREVKKQYNTHERWTPESGN